ncbi:MAG: 50S ribosomal protein L22 [bacterium]|nr:50S ribosomal protein L22 [bacterium]
MIEPAAVAKASYILMSPYKIRRVANLIRGKKIEEVKAILKSLPHRSSEVLYKVVMSAVANAKNNSNLDEEGLVLSHVMINEGPRSKRFKPRARGRIFGIIKRQSHIYVGLDVVKGGV